MPSTSTYVKARVDRRLGEESEVILQRLGLTTADAIRLFLVQVSLHRGLPFEVDLPEENEDLLLPTTMRQASLDAIDED